MLLPFLSRFKDPANVRDAFILLAVFLMPWQARLIFRVGDLGGVPWEGGTLALSALECIILAALLCHLTIRLAGIDKGAVLSQTPPWARFWALFVLYAGISVFWSGTRSAALISFSHLFEGLAFAWLIWRSRLGMRTLLAAFLAGGTIDALFGLWQFLTQDTFASKWLGIAVHVPDAAGSVVVEAASGRWLRAYGLLPHPNVFGGFAAVAILAGFALMVSSTRRWERVLAVSALVPVSAALAVSLSRAAWIALAVGLMVCAARRKGWGTYARTAYGFSLMPLVLTLAVSAIMLGPILFARVQATGRLENLSLSDRALSIAQAVQLFSAHPMTGVGAGNMPPAAYAETTPQIDNPYSYQPAHLVPALIAAELGIVGLLLFLGFMVFWAWETLALFRAAREPLTQLLLAAPIIPIVIGLFDHWSLSLLPGILLTGFLLGLSLKSADAVVHSE
jgi:hypothetical protein